MPPKLAQERRLRHRADARRAILDAAEALLVEGGLDTFSMRKLAERCGYTAPTLYHYFRDKPGLIDALLEERLLGLEVDLGAAELPGSEVENVVTLCEAFALWGLRHPSHYQLLMINRGPEAPEPPAGERVRGLLIAPMQELARRGELTELELETLRQALWSLLHGAILLQTTRPEEGWVPGLLPRSVEALMRGLLEPASGGGR